MTFEESHSFALPIKVCIRYILPVPLKKYNAMTPCSTICHIRGFPVKFLAVLVKDVHDFI